MRHEHEIDPEIRRLYSGKDDAWLAVVQENLRRYAAATLRQCKGTRYLSA